MKAKKQKKIQKGIYVACACVLAGALSGYFVIPALGRGQYMRQGAVATSTEEVNVTSQSQTTHLATPKPLKAVYMTSCVAGTPSLRNRLINLIDTTEINAVVIDIKDYTGKLSFPSNNPELEEAKSDCFVPDMKDVLDELQEKGIYRIARLTSFQDPYYARLHPELAVKRASDGGLWADKKGLNYIDPSSTLAREHLVGIAKEAYDLGFDEINFDYIRFPSDGDMTDIAFPVSKDRPKADVIEDFFKYLHANIQDTGMVISADLFGMTTVNTDDLNIGQVLERALPYFDYIAPMVYPSHYPPTFHGYKDPNQYPYEIVYECMSEAVRRAEATSTPVYAFDETRIGTSTPEVYSKPVFDQDKLRPWLQDFNYGKTYTAEDVKAQIKATYDSGLDSWMLWDPRNVYTKEALGS